LTVQVKAMPELIPAEVNVGSVYFPPALLACVLGLVGAWVVVKLLDRSRMSRFFWHPQLAALAIWACMSLVCRFVLLLL
jgi:hypothetical protein